MDARLEAKLVRTARQQVGNQDPAHDFLHSLRVLGNAKMISQKEGGDLDIIIPSALFHDIVAYPKDHKLARTSAKRSALKTAKILNKIPSFPRDKTLLVCEVIERVSFTSGKAQDSLEAKIIYDADKLEATGAISIMRTFASTGQMRRPFYHLVDPFKESARKPEALKFALDLFFTRLLVVEKKMHTKTAKQIARTRTDFLKKFLEQLRQELAAS